MRIYAVICAQNRKPTVIDAYPPDIPSQITVVDASPPLRVPSVPPMIPAPKLSPSLPVLLAAPLPERSSPLTVPKPSLSLPVSSMLPHLEGTPHLPPLIPVQEAFPSPPRLRPAPLTVPEVRHLLGHLIWPLSTNEMLVLDWSWWRRCHRGMANYSHSQQRLKAG